MQEGLDAIRLIIVQGNRRCTYQTSEVGMRPNRGLILVPRRVRWALDTSCFTTTRLFFRVFLQQLSFRKSQLPPQDVEQRDVDRPRLLHERYDGISHPLIDRSRVRPVHGLWPGEGIVLRDVYKLDRVEIPELVHSACPGSFVAEGNPFVALLKRHLFRERERHGLFAHREHLVDVVIDTVVLQTAKTGGRVRGKKGIGYVLPKSKGGCCPPECFNLGGVILEKFLVVHHKEGVSRNIFGKRRQRHGNCQIRFSVDNPGGRYASIKTSL
jgi:hypothetical protein